MKAETENYQGWIQVSYLRMAEQRILQLKCNLIEKVKFTQWSNLLKNFDKNLQDK